MILPQTRLSRPVRRRRFGKSLPKVERVTSNDGRGLAMMIAALLVSVSFSPFQASSKGETPIEFSKPVKSEGGLGTAGYSESAPERKFSEKVNEKDIRFKPKFELPKPANMTDEEDAKIQKVQKAEQA